MKYVEELMFLETLNKIKEILTRLETAILTDNAVLYELPTPIKEPTNGTD